MMLSKIDTLFWILVLLPIFTLFPTNTFCPKEQLEPISAPEQI